MEPAFIALIMSELWVVLTWFPDHFPALLEFYNRTVCSLSAYQLDNLDNGVSYKEACFHWLVSCLR